MAKPLGVKEQHIAVFGESGSGKTVLVSSFYGPTIEGSFGNDLWDLVADNTTQGNRLTQNYLGMRNKSKVPETTRFAGTTYSFTVSLKGAHSPQARKQPYQALRLAWHDYPGEWFEEEPSSEQEAERRIETFRSLLGSDVAILLVDGQKLLDYEGEEERYLNSLFANFRQGMLRLQPDLLAEEERLVRFPRIWILALSKADLFPDWDVHDFRELIIEKAAEHVEKFHDTLQELVEAPDAMSFGEDFILLSSAKFELAADAAAVEIDVKKQVGVDLIMPVAFILPLERVLQWVERVEVPMKVFGGMLESVGGFATILAGSKILPVGKLVERLPIPGPVAARAVMPALIAAVGLVDVRLKDASVKAREKRDHLTATLTQFKLDLERGVAERLLIRSKR